jgi:tetratricopeptide (TPR) repeat protein
MAKKALGKGLPNHIKEREMKSEFSKIIDAWKGEGYNVTRLDGILDLDIDSISQAFTLFDNDVRNLRDIAEIITIMETKGFESELESIRSKLKDPDQTTDVLQEVHELDNKIKTARDIAAKENTAQKVEEWSSTLNEGKSELMDLWEKSEQEAIVKDPSVLQDSPAEKAEKKSDDDLENRLTSIRARLNKLSLDKSIPLRSDKIEMPDEAAVNTPQEPIPPTEPEAPADEPPQAPDEPSVEPESETPPESASVEQVAVNAEPEPEDTPPESQAPMPPSEPEAPAPPPPSTPEPEPPSEPSGEEVQLSDSQKEDLEEALSIAKEMYRKQEYVKAVEYFNMALEIDPLNSDAIFFKKRAESRMN